MEDRDFLGGNAKKKAFPTWRGERRKRRSFVALDTCREYFRASKDDRGTVTEEEEEEE